MILSAHPVLLRELELRVSAPANGERLPVILFAHGHGSSADGYAPLAQHWAARGFVVVQPTFLDSRRVALAEDDPRRPTIWRSRVAAMKLALDELPTVLAAIPGLPARADRTRIAVAGHSFGAQTAGLLLGARMAGDDEDLSDRRIQVGVLLCAGGRGGADLTPFAAEHFPYLNPSFATLTTPTLVVAGDRDDSPLTVRGPDWFRDPYILSPGAQHLVTLVGGEHMLGGISGERVTETTDEDPARVAAVQRYTTAYLRSALVDDDRSWALLLANSDPRAKVESKPSRPPSRAT